MFRKRYQHRIAGSFLLALFACLAAGPASADSYEDAVAKAADKLAASLASRDDVKGKAVAVARVRDAAAKVVCEPLSSTLRNALRNALLERKKSFSLDFDVVEDMGSLDVRAAIVGRWRKGPPRQVLLSLEMGDPQDRNFTSLGVEEVSFDYDTLPRDARKCLLKFAPVEKEVTTGTTLKVRSGPSELAPDMETMPKGSKLWVAARVITPGLEGWSVVELAPDEGLPVGLRDRRGFVYKLKIQEYEW